ncbi:MAG: GNAT family N-acetyltransferase [Deltaproteobacteria bacterium]|nr:GNAT family N-acetyltransferase [Deltaproteobacteria bacterium]
MLIRKAVKADIPVIEKLINDNLDKLLPRDVDQIARLIDSFFIAENEGEIVGCCCLEVYSHKIAEIRSVAVRGDVREQGIGSELVRAAVESGNSQGIREIMVVTSNLDFFQKLNFTTCLNEKYALFWNGK